MKTEKVICDGCGADLTVRTNIEDYRLVLASESKPGYGAGVYTCMGKYPAVDRTHHFCGLKCLDQWRDHERHYSKLMRDLNDKWKAEHGSRDMGGFRSWPSPPDEVSNEWRRECQTAADSMFPLNANVSSSSQVSE
jgi:hypothetical protein